MRKHYYKNGGKPKVADVVRIFKTKEVGFVTSAMVGEMDTMVCLATAGGHVNLAAMQVEVCTVVPVVKEKKGAKKAPESINSPGGGLNESVAATRDLALPPSRGIVL